MKRVLTRSWKKEPDVVFEDLEWTRVKVELEDDDRTTAINTIEEVLEKVQDDDDKRHVLFLITYVVQQELFKSREIDVETVQNVAAFYPRCVEIDDDDDRDDYNWLTAYDDFKLSPDAEEDEEEDGDAADTSDEDMEDEEEDGDAADASDEGMEAEDSDDGDAADEAADIADPANEDNEFLKFLKEREKREAKDFEEAGMNELKRQSNIMGCSLKQGQEQQILSVMISFFAKQNFRIVDKYRMEMCVEDFMSRVKGYISSTCTLKDPSTVLKAVQSVKKKIKADADPAVHQQRDLFGSCRREPDVVFENLEWTRVKIELKDHDRKTAINAIEDVIGRIQDDDDKQHVLFLIAYAVQQQLFKSKVIAVEMIQKLAAWHPRCVEIDDDDHNDYVWVSAYEDFKLDTKVDADDDADEGFDEYVDDDKEEVADDGNFNDDFKEREAAMKEFKGAYKIELKRRTCTLNDPSTVHEAIESVKKMIEADANAVHQQLENNTVPTNEEGTSECEIVTPFNLPEQEEICLTPPDCENTKTEDCWFATPMNQPEQEEKNMDDVNFCLTTLWEDMKTGECTRNRSKRKLAQL
ncbi:hypothetical protein ACLB2K_052254 [Fragaria x ananassa]